MTARCILKMPTAILCLNIRLLLPRSNRATQFAI